MSKQHSDPAFIATQISRAVIILGQAGANGSDKQNARDVLAQYLGSHVTRVICDAVASATCADCGDVVSFAQMSDDKCIYCALTARASAEANAYAVLMRDTVAQRSAKKR